MPVHYNPFAEKLFDPWEAAAKDRVEHPVAYMEAGDYFQVTSHKAIEEILLNHQVFSSALGVTLGDGGDPDFQVLVMTDPPAHLQHRNILKAAFTQRSVSELAPMAHENMHHLVEALPHEGGTFDLIAKIANPLPVIIVAEMLGVPEEYHDNFRRWSLAAERSAQGIDVEENTLITEELHEFLMEQIDLRRGQDVPSDDLITAVINAEFEGKRFTDYEAVRLIAFLLIAGNSTTTDALGNIVYHLECNPAVKGQFLEEFPGSITDLVEEGLRFDGPVHALFRTAKENAVVEGVKIPKGSRVLLIYGAGNHDPAVFPNPEEFILHRKDSNGSLQSFGWGIHLCLGAQLARMELKVALATLYGRLPNLRLAAGEVPDQKPGLIIRGWESLRMQFDGPVRPREVVPRLRHREWDN